jgi:hypothetical protein
VWKAGEILIFESRGGAHEKAARSHVLPEIDLTLVREMLNWPTQTKAVKELRARLRSKAT